MHLFVCFLQILPIFHSNYPSGLTFCKTFEDCIYTEGLKGKFVLLPFYCGPLLFKLMDALVLSLYFGPSLLLTSKDSVSNGVSCCQDLLYEYDKMVVLVCNIYIVQMHPQMMVCCPKLIMTPFSLLSIDYERLNRTIFHIFCILLIIVIVIVPLSHFLYLLNLNIFQLYKALSISKQLNYHK